MQIYYPINEETARIAHDMMSFRDYQEGSTTASYRADVDAAYSLADRAAALRPDCSEKIYALADRYSRRMADYYNKESSIGTRCPSVMISGGSNFPVRKKEKQVAAWEANHQYYQETQAILFRIRSIAAGKDIIQSDDPDALQKLRHKLEQRQQLQEKMKAANAAIRLKDTFAGDEKLSELGFSAEEIQQLRTPDFCGRVGYPSYELSNNNAEIRRLTARVKKLEEVKTAPAAEPEQHEGFQVVENTESMRLQIIFEDKPDADTRALLKSEGFRWAPSQGAWQRQLTDNARRALARIINQL